MANPWADAVLTAKGTALLTKLVEGHTLDLTRVVAGSGNVPVATLYRQTAVTDEKQTLEFMPITYPEEGKVKLPIRLSNNSLSSGYTANQVGVYATDPEEGEILFFIAQANQEHGGRPIPSANEMPGYSCEWNFYVQYGQADGVTVTVDPTGVMTKDVADGLYAPKSHVDDTEKHVTVEERKSWNDTVTKVEGIEAWIDKY